MLADARKPTPRLRRPGRPTGGDAAVRDALLERSRELFLRHGFGNVSLRRIATAAGTTPAMVHYHFGDKLGLYRAMIETVVQPIIDAVERIGQQPAAATPGLEDVMRMYMRMVSANPWFPALILQEVLAQQGSTRSEFIDRFAGRTAPALVAVLRREREQGKLRRDVDPQFAAVSMLSLCVFPFVSLPITGPVLGFKPEGEALERFIAHTAQLFRSGIAAASVEDAHAH